EKALASPQRIENIVAYIRQHFDQKTKRNSFYQLKERRLADFNSIFATTSIDVCKLYYNEFQNQQKDLPEAQRLKIATIFFYAANEEVPEGGLPDDNPDDTSGLDQSSRDFLENAIADYNAMFKTNFDTSANKFQNYYKDATTLNTLWVDKNLRLHGLLQAYSRTNRILNSIKTFGNIVCFRNLEKATNESIALFGDKEAGGIVLLKSYSDYYNGYESEDGKKIKGYEELIAELLQKYPLNCHCGLDPQSPETGDSVFQRNDRVLIIGEQAQKEFIKLYGGILKVKNILSSFDEFAGNEILSERDVQDYHSIYINLYNEFRNKNKGDSENVNDDIVFEMELIKQVEINIDYILELIRKYHESHLQDKEIVVSIGKAIDSSVELRNKKELIEQFIESLTPATNVDDDWHTFVDAKKIEELNRIIADENLNKEETYKFIQNAFRDSNVPTTGTAIAKILPPISRFDRSANRTQKRETVLDKLRAFFDRFWDISGGNFE
ncbi:MAG: hypothetical protein LBP83_02590, partial [Dysgonamonadaceae bacterium]|nr:hypothetical protein [Dysgonamonadaceae bacterium]